MHAFARELLDPLDIQYTFDTKELSLKKELSAEVRHNLLLIYKEFLTNTIKHSEGTIVNIRFSQKGKQLEMYLQDNGKGFTKENESNTGQGLLNIRMRAEKLKATLNFIHTDGFGIRLVVPGF